MAKYSMQRIRNSELSGRVAVLVVLALTLPLLAYLNIEETSVKRFLNITPKDDYDKTTYPENPLGKFGLRYEDMTEKECKNQRFIVYHCDAKRLCGGWGDRVKGIVTSFLMSLLTNRTFVIRITDPCKLSNFLIPNTYNWGNCLHYLSTVKNRNIHTYDLIDAKTSHLRTLISQNVSFDTFWRKQVVVLRINNILINEFRFHKYAASRLRWMLKTPDDDAITMIVHTLFKPGERLQAGIRTFYKDKVKDKRLVCSHIRSGKNRGVHYDGNIRGFPNVTTILDFLLKYDDNRTNAIYIASDEDSIKKQAAETYDSFICVNKSLYNIDRYKSSGVTRSEACEGFLFYPS